MYVRYLEETAESGSQGQDGIFHLDSVEMESGYSTWKLANVKLNRQLLGKGRALNKKKQRQWRLRVPFASFLYIHTGIYINLFLSLLFCCTNASPLVPDLEPWLRYHV